MAKKTIISPSPGPRRTVVDPTVPTAAENRKRAKATASERPQPVSSRARRLIVGIQPGDLVSVKGFRMTKWVVLSVPDFRGRWQGRAVTTVELLGPNGPETVPLRFCTPYTP